ncbi:MAG: hypothetical protein E3J43_01835 [Candidatus Heimdallarchaeota archaeon]|nr:MAG: hypothetical protein E3J43_01835 [Candidatus Heimdallarchaeota archaeon]
MVNNLDKLEINLEENISNYTKVLNDLLDNISSLSSSKINDILWKLRADLELLIIELKFALEKENKTERWQSSFKEELKGTSSKQKAITMLGSYRKSNQEIQTIFKKKPEQNFRYFWELKETISSILSAFPEQKIKWSNGEMMKISEDVFEI